MALPDFFSRLLQGIRKPRSASTSNTRTYNPSTQDGLVTVPSGREHLNDFLTTRQSQQARQILETLFRYDTDFSAAVGGYLTLADTPITMYVKNYQGQIDLNMSRELDQIVTALTRPTDYSKGFTLSQGLRTLCQELRSMALLRGAIGGELVFGKDLVPQRVQQVDMADIEWIEQAPGEYKPRQNVRTTGEKIPLDIPNFFVAYHRRLPTSIYPESDFVSAINTIAARQQVINDLYRIMRLTGYPRIQIRIVEEVLRKNAPASVQQDPNLMRQWLVDRRNELAGQFADLRADQPFVHFDSSEPKILNEKNAGMSLDISSIIETLNAQNQAGLKTMGTIIGRGNSGVNTASVEARIAAMNADQLNIPVAEFLEQMLTYALHIYGIAGHVCIKFAKAELRPHLELEPQRVIQASRLKTDLSLGLITDLEYHMEVYGRLPPDGTPTLSGTGFENVAPKVDVGSISPNEDALGRSVAPSGSEAARSNQT